ncbi:hypothetical protein D7X33_03020 [Butyricicoccus sp. 1XD8-22]|nr:hypothetical protein D7X33_03020 [Butyricicoccus sp. 1XD8-22]
MKAKKLLSAAITAAMCLNLFIGTGFAIDDVDGNSDANQISDGGGSVSESPDGGDVSELPDGGDVSESPDGDGDASESPDGDGDTSESPDGDGNTSESPDGDGDASQSPDDSGMVLPNDPKEVRAGWTICIYMCGSDLESGGGAATIDLLEMLEAVKESGGLFGNGTLLVMTGGATKWDPANLSQYAADDGLIYNKPSSDRVELFEITSGAGMRRLSSELDSWVQYKGLELTNNMANPETAKIFGSFAIEKFPAEHMMFVFWNHGGAFIGGCELDENSQQQGDSQVILSSADVDDIIGTLKEERGEKLDLVGFDACLMSGMEMAHVLSDSADYMIASEEIEPGCGWDYSWLNNVFRNASGAPTAAAIGKEIIDLYPGGFSKHDADCDEKDHPIWNHAGGNTLALTDLNKIDGLYNAFEEMADALDAITANDGLSDHIADLAFAISLSTGSTNQENLLDVYEYAQNLIALYESNESSLKGHQSAVDHLECQTLYNAAKEVSDCFTFDTDADDVIASGSGSNPIVYRGRGEDAARGGLSVFGPVLNSSSVDEDSESILKVYSDLDILENYRSFINGMNAKQSDIGNFTGSMNITSEVFEENGESKLGLAMQVTPTSAGVSVVNVNAQIAYTDLSTKKSYWLGEMFPDNSDRRNMEFDCVFDGTWLALDGEFSTMRLRDSGGLFYLTIPAYIKEGNKNVPIQLTARLAATKVGDEIQWHATAVGYWEIPVDADKEDVADRVVMMGENPGQKVRLTFYPVLVADGYEMSDPAGWTETGASVSVEIGEGFVFPIEWKELSSGRNQLYEARFALTDIMGKTFLSESVPFFVLDDINDFSVMPIRPQVYEAGKPAEPPILLFFGDTELVEGTHFTVTYSGNDGVPTPGNPVTATATITDIEDPDSTRTLEFLICTEEDYEQTYMNWIADILKATAHVPGDEGTELGASGMLLDMINPLDEYIVHAVLAEELQLRYDLCNAAERAFFTQDRLDAMRRHYSGAVQNTTLTNNGVTLVGALKLMQTYGYLSLTEQPESGLKVTLGQPSAAQLAEWSVDGQAFTDALADARSQNSSVTTAQTYNPVFEVKVPVSDLAWEMVVENLGEGETIEGLDDDELTRRYEDALARIREIFGDVEYVQRPLRQTGESEDLRLALKIAVPSGYQENTASLYRIDGTGYHKLGAEDSLHFITENGVSYAVFETRALHEGCWYVMMAAPKPTDPGSSGGGSKPNHKPGSSNSSNQSNNTTTPVKPDPSDTPDGTQTSFTDVPAGAWYAEAVAFVESRGLMSGSNGRFSPDEKLSRGMLAQILFNAEGRPSGSTVPAFADVPARAWFTDAVAWAAAKNIVSGYVNGLFGPNDSVTREQLAVMLWRYAGSPAPTSQALSFSDADAAGGYARMALCWAVENGIMSGNGGRLDPKGQVTRAQTAQMLKNFIENQA